MYTESGTLRNIYLVDVRMVADVRKYAKLGTLKNLFIRCKGVQATPNTK